MIRLLSVLPAALAFAPADDSAVPDPEEAVSRSVEWLLSRQQADGTWTFIPEGGAPGPDNMSDLGMSNLGAPQTPTALCALALRVNQDVAPRRIEEAVARARRYLLDYPAHVYRRGENAPWTWLYCIRFLGGEYRASRDPTLQAEIRQAVWDLCRALLQDRKMGQLLTARFELPDPPEDPLLKNRFVKEIDESRIQDVSVPKPPMPGSRDGGWRYNTVLTSVSCLTADVVQALLEARELGVPIPEEAIERATRGLEKGRVRGREGEWYHYYFKEMKGGFIPVNSGHIKGSMGRIAVCELALVRGGKRTQDDLGKALELFLEHRDEMEKVRGMSGTHVDPYWNAGYYFLYSHYHAARAANGLADRMLRDRVKGAVQEALLRTRGKGTEDDTWLDHPQIGNLAGTAIALLAIGEARKRP